MPTRLGDILRAAERRPFEKYGLDAVVCWTALWLVLPADARTELAQTRGRLDGALRMWLWGALFIVWTPWTLWAIPIAVVVPLLAYYGSMLGAAKLFGDLIGSGYDLYRMQLYDSLHLRAPHPRPRSAGAERRSRTSSGGTRRRVRQVRQRAVRLRQSCLRHVRERPDRPRR